MEATTSFKVQFNGKFRRFALQEPSYDDLINEISKKFALASTTVSVCYFDEDGDRVDISSSYELHEAIQYALPAPCLKLLVHSSSSEPIQIEKPLVVQQVQVAPLPIVQESVEENVIQPPQLKFLQSRQPGQRKNKKVLQSHQQRDKDVRTTHERRAKMLLKSALKEKRMLVKSALKEKKARVPRVLREKKTGAPRVPREKKARAPRPYMARLVRHENSKKDQELAPDVDFVYVWKLRNTGTLPWTTEFKVVRVSKSESALNAPDSLILDREVAPDTDYKIHIPLHTPNQPGTYECSWRLVNSEGKRFGQRFSCKIVVPEFQENAEFESVEDMKEKRSALRKQHRAENFAKYDNELNKLKELGFKTNNRHVRLLMKFEGNVDQVVTFLNNKKNAAAA